MYELIGSICAVFQELADLVWGFPTNLKWYANLPIIGELPLVIILLVGTGIYFTFKLRFVQIKYFKYGINDLINSQRKDERGISPMASFLLSTAMRVGPGNILGVTGAVSTGGPGALFWMWISAFFGMATAFVESTLSQIYKEKHGDEYVGGLPFYGRKLLGGAAIIGGALSFLYIVYALLCIPAQGFNTISAMTAITHNLTGIAPASGLGIFPVADGSDVFCHIWRPHAHQPHYRRPRADHGSCLCIGSAGNDCNEPETPALVLLRGIDGGLSPGTDFRRCFGYRTFPRHQTRSHEQRGRTGDALHARCRVQRQAPLRTGHHTGNRGIPGHHDYMHAYRFCPHHGTGMAERRR